ncbi:MAG: nitroreductase family protein [bacterium]
MNELLRFLNSHVSARQFTDRPITREEEIAIVETAQRSPTSSNVQAYSVISVRNQQSKNTLARLCGNQDHVSQSALFLVFCADLYRLSGLSSQRGYEFNSQYAEQFIIATVDVTLVAGRALMAAQAMGLGGVMVGGIRNNPDEVTNLLGLPTLVYPVMGMSLGEPTRLPKIKPRLPRTGLHFSEKYNADALAGAVEAYDQTILETGSLKGREVEPDRYPEFSGVYSWSEHTARRNASRQPATQRPHMLKFLQRQGFLRA